MKDSSGQEARENNRRTSLWKLGILLLFSQITIGSIVYLIAIDSNERVQFVAAEKAGLPIVSALMTEIAHISRFRGSCSAVQVLGADLGRQFGERCTESAHALRGLNIEFPEGEMSASTFFDQNTKLTHERLELVDQEFIASNAILDPEPESYQLGFEVYRLLPRMVEAIGVVRGQYALVVSGNLPISIFNRSVGRLEHLLFEYEQNSRVFKRNYEMINP